MAQTARADNALRLVKKDNLLDLESPFHSAMHMARIASSLIENELSDQKEHFAITGRENYYFLGRDDVDAMLFAVYETQRMITDLRNQ